MPKCRENWRRKRVRSRRNVETRIMAKINRLNFDLIKAWRSMPISNMLILDSATAGMMSFSGQTARQLALDEFQAMMFGLRQAGNLAPFSGPSSEFGQ